jgi:LEA14-like dessication related protein
LGAKFGGQTTAALAILALIAVGLSVWSLVNYQEGVETLQSFQLDLTEVQISPDDTEVRVALRLENDAPLDLLINHVHFSLYLNGNFMGSNYTPWVERELKGFQGEQVELIIPLRPFYMQYVEDARAGEGFAWSIRGFARIYLPRYDHEVNLNVRETWSRDDE